MTLLDASSRFPWPLWRPSERLYWAPSALSASQTAVWVALGFGVATLGVQGARYARIEELGRTGTLAAIAVNLFLGLVMVGLKALLAH